VPILDKDNPLFGREWRGGRSCKKFYYTIEDIAKAAGRSVGTIRNDTYKKILDADDLVSVAKYVSERLNNG